MRRGLIAAILLLIGCARTPERALVETVDAHLAKGRYAEAMRAVRAFEQGHPGTALGLELRVLVRLAADDLPGAGQELKSATAPEAVLFLVMRHRNAPARANAIRLLGTPSAAARRPLLRALDDAAPEVRVQAARALGRLRHPAATKPLFRALRDGDWRVRAEAIDALVELGDPRAAGWFYPLLTDGDGFVRFRAATGLREIAAPANHAMLQRLLVRTRGEAEVAVACALAKLADPLALAPLARLAGAGDREVRRRVATALAECELPAVTNTLRLMLADADPGVSELARTGLRRWSSEKTAGTTGP